MMQNFFKNYVPPTSPQMLLLQEIITSISTSKVARKLYKNTKGVKSDFCYETMEHSMEVYIHPNSCLKSEHPEFIVYDELIHTSKYFMRNVTKVDNLYWLIKYDEYGNHKITYLKEKDPIYSKKKAQMIVFASSNYGPKNWTLPAFEVWNF